MDIYEGLVVDVITNETHPEYSTDGFNFGMIRVRFLREKTSLRDDKLYLAHPMDLSVCDLPLIGEIVLVYKVLGTFHYTRMVSVSKNINMNAAVGQNEIENARFNSDGQTTSPAGEHLFNKTKEKFLHDESVRLLRPFPGDYIYQSRFGASTRMGSSLIEKGNKKLNPNFLLSVGKPKDTPQTVGGKYGLILEDINKDATSIWAVSDQKIPLTPATLGGVSYLRSAADTPVDFSGAQLILNSSQIVLNSKKNPIYLFSATNISLNTLNNVTIDADNKIFMTAENDINSKSGTSIYSFANKNILGHALGNILFQGNGGVEIIGNKVFIGSLQDDKEPMVLGTELSKFLGKLIQTLLKSPVGFGPMGPVPWNPAITAGLTALLQQLTPTNSGQMSPTAYAGAPFNSLDNFVSKDNKLEKF